MYDCRVRRSIVHFSVPTYQFQGFAGLRHAYEGGRHAYYGLVGDEPQHLLLVGVEVPVGLRFGRGAQYGYLPLQSADGSIHVGLAQSEAGVTDKVAGGEVVAPVHHQVVSGNQLSGVGGSQPAGVCLYLQVAVQGLQASGGTVHLGLAYFGFHIQHLPLQVADAHRVIVHQPQCAYPGSRQVEGDG